MGDHKKDELFPPQKIHNGLVKEGKWQIFGNNI